MKVFSFAQNWWQFLLSAVVCYFIGCFNFALVISKTKKRDITKIGSGNPGTMNMSREFGLKIGLLTFFCDVFKGGLPALAGYFIYRNYVFAGTLVSVSDFARYFFGLFVVIGHIFPVTMRFKGGKGIASTLGMFWACLSCENPWWILFAFGYLLFLVVFIFVTEWGSMGSLVGVSGFSIMQMVWFLVYRQYALNAYTVTIYCMIIVINLLTWIAHKENLLRLFAGEEHRTSIRKLAKKK